MAKFNPLRFLSNAARNSPWVVIAVAMHAVIIAGMSVIYLAGHREKAVAVETNVTLAPPRLEEVIQPPEIPVRKAPPKNEEAEIIDYEHDIYVPTDDTPIDEDLSKEIGNPDAEGSSDGASGGTAIGAGMAAGHHSSGVPSTFSTRRVGTSVGGPAGRRPVGVTQSTETAVRDGLLWLIRHQQADGSWSAASVPAACINDKKCVDADAQFQDHYQAGLTGLALLAFLGAGYNFDSKQVIVDVVQAKKFKIGEVIKSGLEWIKDRQQPDGSFGPNQHVYNHALCALALTEAYGLSKNRVWRDPAQKAIDWLVAAQKHNPENGELWGWRYYSRTDIQAALDQVLVRKAAVDAKSAPLDAKWNELETRRKDLEARQTELPKAQYEAELKKIATEKKEIDLAREALLPEINAVSERMASLEEELGEADLSVTTWVIMAFKSAEASGLTVSPDAYQGGKNFVHAVSAPNGTAGYMTLEEAGRPIPGPGAASSLEARDGFIYHVGTMSALSMLCRTFVDHDIEDPYLEAAAKVLMKDLPEISKDKFSVDYYYWYYGSLALNQLDGPDSPRKGGRYWEPWNKAMQEAVLGTQDGTEKACTHGGWVSGDRWAIQGGPIYSTAMNVLTLEVYYRYENAFGSAARFGTPPAGKPK